ncbi:VOC family protein [Haloglycomyces albus]|uniref:VOC family protein n=1 Tax=Haloglycomyces albus TaxID=526067 RepID=UPI00046D65BF|nr:VOC family protein [Haloglycomyces albus]
MTKMFINLPVADLDASKEFYQKLGWDINPMFTDDNAACIVIKEDQLHLMLLKPEFFKMFTKRTISDTQSTIGATYALALDSKEEVNDITGKALQNGATEEIDEDRRKMEEEAGMYGRTFIDPNGFQWELFYMPTPTQ